MHRLVFRLVPTVNRKTRRTLGSIEQSAVNRHAMKRDCVTLTHVTGCPRDVISHHATLRADAFAEVLMELFVLSVEYDGQWARL